MDSSISLVIVLIVIVGILTSWIKPARSLPWEDDERSRKG